MARTVFSVRELCDPITEHLTLHEDLKSAALVCHTLCVSAQSQIFRHVILDPWELPVENHRGEDPLELTLRAFHRLSVLLATSPHLRRFIQHLSVVAKAEILEPLSNIQFPALRKIRFNFDGLNLSDDDVLDSSDRGVELHVLRLARGFIGLPSIHEVELVDLGELPLDSFASLFDTCSPYLEALVFNDVAVPATLPSVSLPRPSERRVKIKQLTLIESPNVPYGLISPSSPFDFTGLVAAEITATNMSPALVQIMTAARRSLKRLHFICTPMPCIIKFSLVSPH
ncbi:hypothetical protein DFH09DRAFT_1361671 [Mycena vulgaris]|nr:hypothetical protein DFH09DRAFT_1361671 [Mycena vulgaris]